MLNELPPELISNILSRLPVDSLLRFRCVSKSYCAEIDDPNFIKTHSKISMETNSNLGVIFSDLQHDSLYSVSFDSFDRVVELDYPLKIDVSSYDPIDIFSIHNIKIVGSCNGLLCFSNSVGRVALINPATRKYQILPFLPLEHKSEERSESVSWTLGFGYDPIADDYKVVRLGQFIGFSSASFMNETMIYSLKSNSWREISGMSYVLGTDNKMGLLLGDALHWSVDVDRIMASPSKIVAFNLGTEKFTVVPEPELSGGEEKLCSLCILSVGRRLSICANYGIPKGFEIWVMKEYGVKESWTKLISVTPNLLSFNFKGMTTLPFSKNGDELLMGIQGRNLVWYNLKEKTLKLMEVHDVGTPFGGQVFHGSLVPLNASLQAKTNKAGSSKGKKNRDDFLSKGFKLKLPESVLGT
ncbi:F-box protein CPR1-like [Euphorbia lathyris]|uniref:F-box protein CPR1-like n=1 Tax=Euphorbia lathyris TaxID=212925 RepID=UPI0033144AC7